MTTRRAASGPHWQAVLPAILAVLAFASWTAGLRSPVTGTIPSSVAALAADADALLGTMAERSGRREAPGREPTGGRSGDGAASRPAGASGGPLYGLAAARRPPRLAAPEGAARRLLERAGRPGAPTTAPPRTS